MIFFASPKYSSPVAPTVFWAFMVNKPIIMAGIRNGIFSIISCIENFRFLNTSMQNSETGNITAAGFDKRDRITNSNVSQYCFFEFESRYFVYEIWPAIKNNANNTSFLSETHATDSTCNG